METKTVNLRNLPEELVRRAKACAAIHGLTLKDFVLDAISRAVERDIPATTTVAALIGSPNRRKARKRK